MKVSQAATLWLNYHRVNSSENTIRAYKELLDRFCQKNGDKDLKELTPDDVLDFLNGITEGKKPQTRKTRLLQRFKLCFGIGFYGLVRKNCMTKNKA